MSKKLFIIIISVILGIFLIGLISYYFVLQGTSGTTGGTSGVFKNFFPFGGGTPATTTVITSTETPPVTTPTISNYTQKLRKISSEPVAGAGVMDFKAGTVVRHIEKATGHIFETELFSPSQNRISNTTIPMVYDAVWGNNNNSLIARYLKDDNQTIDAYSVLIKPISTTTENIISAIKLPGNLVDISVLGSSVFSLEKTDSSSIGYISNFDGSKRVQIWNSPIREVLSQYVTPRIVALTTKPESTVGGFLFFVDTGNARITTVLSNIFGLSTLVNDLATQVLVLDQGVGPTLSMFDIRNNSFTRMTPLTFPEKCVWGKKDRNIVYCAVPEEYIDNTSLTSWYLGSISYTDDIWKYDIKNQTSSMIEGLYNDSGEKIDVIKPILSQNEQYIVFINKIDGSLWSLDLSK